VGLVAAEAGPQALPRAPRERGVEGVEHLVTVGAGRVELGREGADQLVAQEGLAVPQPCGDLGGERAVHVGGPADGAHGLEQQGSLVHEPLEALLERQVGRDREHELRHPLHEPLGDRSVERLEVVEVLEDRPHGHGRGVGDAGRGRPEVTLFEQGDRGVDDGLTGAHRPLGAAVDGSDRDVLLHGPCSLRLLGDR
jgi:hypothetical protein